jgi:large repetitive protein
MHPKPTPSLKRIVLPSLLLLLSILFYGHAHTQMRLMSYDPNSDDEIRRISFYSPTEGYVSYGREIGFTADSGHSFTRKPITTSNVDFNSYEVNLTFGFLAGGVKALDRNNVIVYGAYALVPAILRSQDGGNTFKLVFHSPYAVIPNSAVEDMAFPSGNLIGFAVDRDRILKTTDGGWSWSVVKSETDVDLRYIDAVDNNTIVAISASKAFKTINSGSTWQNINLQSANDKFINYVHFRTASRGWMSLNDNSILVTNDGGISWSQQNDVIANPFGGIRIKFIDDNNGYAIGDNSLVYKSTDGGKLWEPLKRNHKTVTTLRDLFFLSSTQFWAAGSKELVEMTTNGGGSTTPKAYFIVDSAQYTETGKVRLVNRSKPGYTVKWLVNGVTVGTTDNVEYGRTNGTPEDEITLIVSNGTDSDTSSIRMSFPDLVIVSSFSPTSAANKTQVTISGASFYSVTSVTFGGVEAESFWVESPFSIKAIVGQGASGEVRVTTTSGSGKLAGFTFLPPPHITSFSPTSAKAGAVVTITGTDFANATQVYFAGIPAQSLTVVSDTTITAVVPSGPSGFITVESPYGSGSLNTFISLPVITSFTPDHGTQGTIMTIEGTSLTDINAVTIGGVPAQSFEVISGELVNAIVHTGATGSVLVSKTGGSSTRAGFTWYPPPVITSFSPASGSIGTSVTITGQNFDNTPSNNIVFFGDIKAVVTAASSTSLQVTVPAGATFKPISVTNHNLTAYSHYPFVVTFANGGTITPGSFTIAKEIPAEQLFWLSVGDLDGDGKNDIIASGPAPTDVQGIAVYRNTTTGADPTFADPVAIPGSLLQFSAVADFDGDGKPDVAVVGDQENIEVFHNRSTQGNINFAKATSMPAGMWQYGIAMNDVDGDGKIDLASHDGWVYRNVSNPGKIAFAEGLKLDIQGGRNVVLIDVDGDKKPELISPDGLADKIDVLKNNSTKGNISFGNRISFPGFSHSYISCGDIDNDGKPDIVTGNNEGKAVAVLKNNSTLSGISFSAPVSFSVPSYVEGVTVGDIDGDGKPDIALGVDDIKLGILKNTAAGSNISFAPMVEFTPGSYRSQHLVEIADFNSDGKNDLVAIDELSKKIHIYSNHVLPEPFVQSFTPSSGLQGTTVTITGQNFANVTAVTFGGTPAASFTVDSASAITAILGSGASGDVSVTNNFGTGTKAGFFFGSPLSITSFSPTNGSAGSSVKITGNNFSASAADNIVYFGAVKAVVTSASSSELQVVVPVGATYQPITVTVGGRTAHSVLPFIVTFPGAERFFSSQTFTRSGYEHAGAADAVADIDGDGKSDLLIAGVNNQIFIAANRCMPGVISFANNISFAHIGTATHFATGDLDGDGRPDIVSNNYNDNTISIWRNNSTPGNFSLAQAIELPTGQGTTNPSMVAIRDVDGDGQPDIVVSNYTSKTISLFRNSSTGSMLAFDTRFDIPVTGAAAGLFLNDMNDDDKTDIVVSLKDIDRVVLFQNNGVPGIFTFKTGVEYVAQAPENISFTDFNVDGKPDILFTNVYLGGASVLLNDSENGNPAFRGQVLASGGIHSLITSGDIDGDSRPDVLACNSAFGALDLFKNSATNPDNYITIDGTYIDMRNESPNYASLGDIDGDAMPDIAVNKGGTLTAFFINATNLADTIKICEGSDTALIANVIGSVYKWQKNTGSGFADITDDQSISGSSTSKLILRDVTATWNGYEFRCITDGILNRIHVIRLNTAPAPEVSITGSDTTVCRGAQVTFAASSKNEGSVYGYIWKVNGFLHSAGPTLSINASSKDSVIVQLLLITNAECRISDTLPSKGVVIKQYPRDTLGVQIAGATNVMRGQSTVIVATSNPTRLPISYQWQDSTQANGWNNIVGETGSNIDYTLANNGDRLRCMITGNSPCETEEVWSNTLQFTIGDASVITSEKLRNNPVTNGILTIDSLKLSDNWETLEIINSNTGQRQQIQQVTGQTSLRIFVSGLSSGVYVAVLRSRSRPPIHFKFMKM